MANYPNNRLVKMRAAMATGFNPGAGAMASRYFRANSIFDIMEGITPGVPANGAMGFKEWIPFFESAMVVSAKMTFKITSTTGQTVPGVVALRVSSDPAATPEGVWSQIANGNTKWSILQSAVNGRPVTLTCYFNQKRFFGLKDIADNQEPYGMVLTDPTAPVHPTEAAFFIATIQANDTAADLQASWFTAEIEYTVLWSNPRRLTFAPPEEEGLRDAFGGQDWGMVEEEKKE